MNQKRHTAKITKVTPIMPDPTTLEGYTIEQDCGHTYVGAPHFSYTVGERRICATHDNDCQCYYCTHPNR